MQNNLDPIAARLLEFIDSTNMSVNAFAKHCGMTSSEKLARVFRKAGLKPSVDILELIANTFASLNTNWLLTGVGSMLVEDREQGNNQGNNSGNNTRSDQNKTYTFQDVEAENRIPVLSASNAAAWPSQNKNPEFLQNLPTAVIPSIEGPHVIVQIGEDAMEPSYKINDFVIARKVASIRQVRPGKAYIFVLCDELIIRRVGKLKSELSIEMEADNPDVPSFEIEKESILETWNIVSRITNHVGKASVPTIQELKALLG